MSDDKCRTPIVHHPDCECQWCMAHVDELCAEPTVATCTERSRRHGQKLTFRVCERHAVTFHLEDDLYDVTRDDGCPVLAS